MLTRTTLIYISVFVVSVFAHPHTHGKHAHVVPRSLPSNWHHDAGHPINALFNREASKTSPEPYSPAWVASFPSWSPDANAMPQAWKDSLRAAVDSKKIPAIPVAKSGGDSGIPTYPQEFDPNDPKSACSATYGCRLPGDIWDAPDGIWGISFDDGPLPETSEKLYNFLQKENQHATHFMIGTNILGALDLFKFAYETLKDDIAVHTWTHPQMTTLSNEQVVAELGYTILVIHDLTGGRVPRFWRPPTGDSDARVSAIAREVFGLTTMIWNQDTGDWGITESRTTVDKVNQELEQWFNGPKSPGIIILEHELSDESVGTFISSYEKGIKAGWKAMPATANAITDTTVYRNAADDTSAIISVDLAILPGATTIPPGALVAATQGITASGAEVSGAANSTATSTLHTVATPSSSSNSVSGTPSTTPAATDKQSGGATLSRPGILAGAALFLLVVSV